MLINGLHHRYRFNWHHVFITFMAPIYHLQKEIPDVDLLGEQVTAQLDAGCCSIHSDLTVHGSFGNCSERRRAGSGCPKASKTSHFDPLNQRVFMDFHQSFIAVNQFLMVFNQFSLVSDISFQGIWSSRASVCRPHRPFLCADCHAVEVLHQGSGP